MSFGVNLFFILTHPVDAIAAVRIIVVHHVSQKSFELVKPSAVGDVGLIKSKVPFANDGCLIARFFENSRQKDGIFFQVAPGIFLLLPYDAGDANKIGVKTGQECSPAGRTYR